MERMCIIMCKYMHANMQSGGYERVRKRARVSEKRETESDRERDWDWHVFWWSGVVFHINVWCLCCQVPEMWFRKERREKKGKAEKKEQGRWSFFFFFMWRRWQLPCIALSLNNGMLICITRDVITSTVKRKHNNSSSAPPWDRLGWPTLALERDALELRLSQAHTKVHTHTYVCACMHALGWPLKLSRVQLSSSHMQSSNISCWAPTVKHICTLICAPTQAQHCYSNGPNFPVFLKKHTLETFEVRCFILASFAKAW